jgi:CDP-glucose 4,6-dehydratase
MAKKSSTMENMVGKNLSRNNFWKNKKVFITGHTGFKGSWLCLLLNQIGAKIAGYSLPPKNTNIIFKEANIKNIIFYNFYGDIRDKKKLSRCLKKFKPDILIHMAAQPIVLDSYTNPKETFDINFNGTLNILELIKKLKIKSSIIVTTDKVYKNYDEKIIFKESDSLGGSDPYSSSKAAVEILVDSYNQSFFKSKNQLVATVRAGNVVGGGDRSSKRIIPDFFRSFKKKQKLLVRSPNSIRPWLFVLEPLIGYLMVAEANYKNRLPMISQSWNFSPISNKFYTVKYLIEEINKNFKIKISYSNKKNIYEKKFINLSSYKAKKYLGWKSFYNIKKTLMEIINWENNYIKKQNIYSFCSFQIKTYLKKIKWQ